MVDDKELPEWYQMAKGFFREIEVFSMSMYSEMNGSGILAQIRYAAIREAAQQSVQADGLQAALFGESNTITLARGDEVLHIRRR